MSLFYCCVPFRKWCVALALTNQRKLIAWTVNITTTMGQPSSQRSCLTIRKVVTSHVWHVICSARDGWWWPRSCIGQMILCDDMVVIRGSRSTILAATGVQCGLSTLAVSVRWRWRHSDQVFPLAGMLKLPDSQANWGHAQLITRILKAYSMLI